MRRYDYPKSFATGVIAAAARSAPCAAVDRAGRLRIITGRHGSCHRRFIPASCAAMDMMTVVLIGKLRPKFLPAPRHSWAERAPGCATSGRRCSSSSSHRGLYGDCSRPRNGGVGASAR